MTSTTAPTPPPDVQRLQSRTLIVLAGGQLLGGLGLAAGVAVGALLARDLGGGDALAGMPSAVATAGGALAAIPLSRLMARSGRRPGLLSGYATGGLGATIVIGAAQIHSFALLLVGMVAFGVGNTASLLARYAAADLAEPSARGRAVSTVLFATTFGAAAGPNLVAPMGALARAAGLPELAGPFCLSVVAYAAAATVVGSQLRPDPLLTARALDVAAAESADPVAPTLPVAAGARGTAGADADQKARRPATDTGSAWPLLLHGPALAGLSAMVGAQFVMVAMMTMTPVHMRAHDHSLGLVGLVISIHIAGMYALSPLGGLLVDRIGAPSTLRLGAGSLAAAGLLGALADPASAPALAVALFLLGLGWSLSLVGGTTLLTAAIPIRHRARAQGNADLLVGLAGATGGLGSGLLLALSGFAALGLLTAAVAAGLLAAAQRGRRTRSA